jgi:hypothetical protein
MTEVQRQIRIVDFREDALGVWRHYLRLCDPAHARRPFEEPDADTRAIYDKLRAIDFWSASRETFEEIIGRPLNPSFDCDICEQSFPVIVELGEIDYGCQGVWICEACLQAALEQYKSHANN